ncbi:heavy metal translocating P-type ATPase [Thermoflavimicrobium dichotomicum]|uniref:Cd(2+)-exporting ATPase n=1 Tax=Thermoflavimicrobium dichotomicum TaxID=46223 RepID=A0A1I3U6H9_9BACL|nr:heavy metal translocating P-type ATPase [Thermoflavimicrobium dichotomicum]SFJ79178.1 Cd2+/Zn2+-exporting ATPase [Thermoflavimicrobium dichotomicum]
MAQINHQTDTCCHGPYSENKPSCQHSSIGHAHVSALKTTIIQVDGMDCPSCAQTIEKNIRNLPGVEQVQVHYSTGKMKLVGEKIDLQQVLDQLNHLGYTGHIVDSKQQTQVFHVEGMDCTSCAKSIEKHFASLSWVDSVEVHFASSKMRISHQKTAEAVLNEIKRIGYRAALSTEIKPTSSALSTLKNNWPLWVAGISLVLGLSVNAIGLNDYFSIFFYALSIVIGGYKPAKSAFYALKNRSLDMNVLMVAATIGATWIGEWLEGATVVWLFALGNWLQVRTLEKTRHSIRELMDLAPSEAWVKTGQGLKRLPVETVQVGQIIVVKPGEKIPLDGIIVTGSTSVNQAPITGESMPADKHPGNEVYAGSINETGSIEVKVTHQADDTTLAKIIHLVEEAQEKQAPTQNFVDRFAQIYTPIVFSLAMLVILLPPLFGLGEHDEWLYRGLELLVIACPCALVISTPVAIVSAIGNAAKKGVLIKGGAFLELAGQLQAIAFDKTGTLTQGNPRVIEVQAINKSEEWLLAIAQTIEEHSRHPIARAILQEAQERNISMLEGSDHKTIVGHGAQATIDGTVYFAGNQQLFEELHVSLDPVRDSIQKYQKMGHTLVLIGTEKEILGLIAIADPIRPTSKQTIYQLKQSGIQSVMMLTGDQEETARKVAREVGVDEHQAQLLPEHKVEAIKQLQQRGWKVGMVGDGMNDAPALATADLGIAMGGIGTDTAMETAGIVLMADHLEQLPFTIRLSRKALKIIKQNITFSIMVKLVALLLIFPDWLTLWIAVLSDTGAALLVILNSMRLLRFKESSK